MSTVSNSYVQIPGNNNSAHPTPQGFDSECVSYLFYYLFHSSPYTYVQHLVMLIIEGNKLKSWKQQQLVRHYLLSHIIAILNLPSGKDVFVLAPTGMGKV